MNANRGCRGRFCPFFAVAAAGFLPLHMQIQVQVAVSENFCVCFRQKEKLKMLMKEYSFYKACHVLAAVHSDSGQIYEQL